MLLSSRRNDSFEGYFRLIRIKIIPFYTTFIKFNRLIRVLQAPNISPQRV